MSKRKIYGVRVEDEDCDNASGYNYLDYGDWQCDSREQAEEMLEEMVKQGSDRWRLEVCCGEVEEGEEEGYDNDDDCMASKAMIKHIEDAK